MSYRVPIKVFLNNVLLIAVPAFFIRFIIWIITISIDTGSNIAWKSTTLLKWRKLFTPDILSQDGLLDGLYITVSITLTAWLICIFIAIILSFLSYNYSYLRVPVSILMWLSNFHLLFGFLFLYFKWEGEVTPEKLCFLDASDIQVCNKSLSMAALS